MFVNELKVSYRRMHMIRTGLCLALLNISCDECTGVSSH